MQKPMVKRMAGQALAKHGVGRFFDLGLGMALMRDSRVPMRHKAMAMGVAAALVTGLVALEVPMEGMLAMVLPLLGPAVDLAVDGAEETLGTLMLAMLLIQRMAPREVVDAIRSERA